MRMEETGRGEAERRERKELCTFQPVFLHLKIQKIKSLIKKKKDIIPSKTGKRGREHFPIHSMGQI